MLRILNCIGKQSILRGVFFVRDAIKLKEVIMKFLSTNKMVAASLTKPTPRDVFKTHMMSLGLVEFS